MVARRALDGAIRRVAIAVSGSSGRCESTLSPVRAIWPKQLRGLFRGGGVPGKGAQQTSGRAICRSIIHEVSQTRPAGLFGQ
jgi:hypothetical protein